MNKLRNQQFLIWKRSEVTEQTTVPKIGERQQIQKITTYQSRNLWAEASMWTTKEVENLDFNWSIAGSSVWTSVKVKSLSMRVKIIVLEMPPHLPPPDSELCQVFTEKWRKIHSGFWQEEVKSKNFETCHRILLLVRTSLKRNYFTRDKPIGVLSEVICTTWGGEKKRERKLRSNCQIQSPGI